MSADSGPHLSVAEFVEYCRTQAALLSGRVETIDDEATALLDEIDDGMAEVRSRLEKQGAGGAGPVSPSTAGSADRDADLASIEELQRDLEEKQAIVDAKQARIQAFQELAVGYTDLAEELSTSIDDGREALTRVVEFEADRDAPAYFDDRQTVLEAALEGSERRESDSDAS
ncbi:hypothetical protein [Halosolutus gelatinilyticus]|uniref:hypothetical protein n=1 Tax=Halosolutus gelatinilyticus TaxID=2931975 RepID=UPI001FF15E29|nr:hypothetical protein [Halosolutus gelatinilyticus]